MMDMWLRTKVALCEKLDRELYFPFLELVEKGKAHNFGHMKELFKNKITEALDNLRLLVEVGDILEPGLTDEDITRIREDAEKISEERIFMEDTAFGKIPNGEIHYETYVCANRDCGGNLMNPCVTHDWKNAKCPNEGREDPEMVARWVKLEDFCNGWMRMGYRAVLKDVAEFLNKEGKREKISVKWENIDMKEECYDVIILFGKILNEETGNEKPTK